MNRTRFVQGLVLITAILTTMFATVPSRAGLAPRGRVVSAVKFTSVYTNLKTQCWADGKAGEGQDQALKCKGYGGYVIKIGYSAASSHLRIESSTNDSDSVSVPAQPINYDGMGRKVEWRLANGKPFAVILRIDVPKDGLDPTELWQPGNLRGQSLLVLGLGKFKEFSAEIDAKTPGANVGARQSADTKFDIGL